MHGGVGGVSVSFIIIFIIKLTDHLPDYLTIFLSFVLLVKTHILYQITIAFLFIGNINSSVNAQENLLTDSMNFKIIIINNYYGRVNNRTIVTEDSLSYETLIYRGNSVKKSRLLTNEEKTSIENYIKDFPLNKLENQYVTNAVKDGTQMKFIISINNNSKEIFIANVYQENLGELVKLVVTMLPEDFIQYKKELIYPY